MASEQLTINVPRKLRNRSDARVSSVPRPVGIRRLNSSQRVHRITAVKSFVGQTTVVRGELAVKSFHVGGNIRVSALEAERV